MLNTVKDRLNQRQVRETWQQLTKTDKVNVDEFERLVSLVGGGLLSLYGLLRFSKIGLTLVLTGGYLIYRGLTGHCLAYEASGISTASRTERLQFKSGSKPGARNGTPIKQERRPDHIIQPDNPVDEAAWDSFPASDPPAWSTS
jgi:hypothetical protein